MKKNTYFWLILTVIFISIFMTLYIVSNSAPASAVDLASKVSTKLSSVDSYEYSTQTVLSNVLNEDKITLMTGTGTIDYKNKKAYNVVNVQNKTSESILIGDYLYAKNDDVWMRQDARNAWHSADQLSLQKLALGNSSSMQKTSDGYILELNPPKQTIVEELAGKGFDSIGPDEINSYKTTFEIEKDYKIKKITTKIQLELNIQGLITPMNLVTTIDFYNYDKDFDIAAPIIS